MATALSIDRTTRDGAYAKIIDVAERLAREKYGSASNALLAMVQQSGLYTRTLAAMEAEEAAKK